MFIIKTCSFFIVERKETENKWLSRKLITNIIQVIHILALAVWAELLSRNSFTYSFTFAAINVCNWMADTRALKDRWFSIQYLIVRTSMVGWDDGWSGDYAHNWIVYMLCVHSLIPFMHSFTHSFLYIRIVQ